MFITSAKMVSPKINISGFGRWYGVLMISYTFSDTGGEIFVPDFPGLQYLFMYAVILFLLSLYFYIFFIYNIFY